MGARMCFALSLFPAILMLRLPFQCTVPGSLLDGSCIRSCPSFTNVRARLIGRSFLSLLHVASVGPAFPSRITRRGTFIQWTDRFPSSEGLMKCMAPFTTRSSVFRRLNGRHSPS